MRELSVHGSPHMYASVLAKSGKREAGEVSQWICLNVFYIHFMLYIYFKIHTNRSNYVSKRPTNPLP